MKIFSRGKEFKAPAVIEIMTYRFVVFAPIHYALLLDNNFRKETIYKILLIFIVYFDK